MRNIACVLWLLLFPLTNALTRYLLFLQTQEVEKLDPSGVLALFCIWIFGGYLFFEPRITKKTVVTTETIEKEAVGASE